MPPLSITLLHTPDDCSTPYFRSFIFWTFFSLFSSLLHPLFFHHAAARLLYLLSCSLKDFYQNNCQNTYIVCTSHLVILVILLNISELDTRPWQKWIFNSFDNQLVISRKSSKSSVLVSGFQFWAFLFCLWVSFWKVFEDDLFESRNLWKQFFLLFLTQTIRSFLK